jgi:hypothetical protein
VSDWIRALERAYSAHPGLFVALALSFGLSLLPFGQYLLYPFKLFTTWAHECSHALFARALGATITKITLSPDTSGLTLFRIPPGRLRQGIVASMGYLGSCALGCGIFYVSARHPGSLNQLLVGLGGLMLLSLLAWVRGGFGMSVTLLLGGSLLALGLNAPALSPAAHARITGLVIPFLAIQTALNSLFDLRVLFGLSPRARSDAQAMSSLFWLPAGFWALLWIALSIGMMALTMKWSGWL